MMVGRLAKTWLAGFLLLWAQAGLAAEKVPLYTYYVDPPFAVGADSLTDKLAAWLSQRSQGRYLFVPTQLPRRRLDALIAQPHWRGVVAWANPAWFDETVRPRQSWTRPYMVDANLVVSLRSEPIAYENDRSLEGRRVGSVLGFSYPDLDAMLKAGKLTRDDANGEFQNLLKLKLQRVQVAFLQASSFPYFRREFPDMDDWAYVAAKPRTVFERSLFMAPGQPALRAFLDAQLDLLIADRDWQTRLGTCPLVAPGLVRQMDATRKLCR
jgi:polar amino acid transport system substrate-binding protein